MQTEGDKKRYREVNVFSDMIGDVFVSYTQVR